MITRLAASVGGAGLLVLALIQTSALVHAQEATTQKHMITAPENGSPGAMLWASEIQRGPSYPSMIHLTGNVQIRSSGFIVQANAAEYDESTGIVQAHGDVTVTPYPAPEKSAAPGK
jgi:lipopolysaccharide assembly outer membrane protein LptD (OstA)